MKTPTKLNLVLSALAQILKWIPAVVFFLPVQILCLIVQKIGDAAHSTSAFFQDAAYEWVKLFKPTFHDQFVSLTKQVACEKERGDMMAESYTWARGELETATAKITELENEIHQLNDDANMQ